MSKVIEVRVPVSKAQENVIFANMRVINELREAGVPTLGATVLQCVSDGKLSTWLDTDRDEYVYEWTGELPEPTVDPLNDDEDDEL